MSTSPTIVARFGVSPTFHALDVEASDDARFVSVCGRSAPESIVHVSIHPEVGCGDCRRRLAAKGRVAA